MPALNINRQDAGSTEEIAFPRNAGFHSSQRQVKMSLNVVTLERALALDV